MSQPKYDYKQSAYVCYTDCFGTKHGFSVTTVPESVVGFDEARAIAISAAINLARRGNKKRKQPADPHLAQEMIRFRTEENFEVKLGTVWPTRKINPKVIPPPAPILIPKTKPTLLVFPEGPITQVEWNIRQERKKHYRRQRAH